MTCPHYSPISAHACRCALLQARGVDTVAGPANPNHPCPRCYAEWADGRPPTPETLTPTLERLVEVPVGEPAEQLPGVLEMAANFTGAMARWAKAGFRTVAEATFRSRLAICEGCEHWQGNRCGKCGCQRLKLHLPDERCPIGKW